MRLPARFMRGQLIWTYGGEVVAGWRISPPTYRRLPRRERLGWHQRTAAALMVLPGDSMIMGVAAPVDPSRVVDQMLDGVDLKAHPGWAHIALDTLDRLTEARLYERRHYLFATLSPAGRTGRSAQVMASAGARVAHRFRLPPMAVSAREFHAYERQAADLGAVLAGTLGAERIAPLDPAEIHWLYARSGLRGGPEPSAEEFTQSRIFESGEGSDATLRGPCLTPLADYAIHEGGTPADPDRPRHRRYLRVEGERAVTFQTLAAVSDMPAHFTFPGGGEFLARLDELAFPVDWWIRVSPTPNAKAQGEIKGKLRDLTQQYEEYGGDHAGAPPSLSDAVDRLHDEWARLGATPGAPELRVSFVFAVGATSPADMERQMDALRSTLEVNEFLVPRPHGDQSRLYLSGLPGSATPAAAKDYTIFMLPADLAGTAPLAGSHLGDPRGALLALNLDAARAAPVLFRAAEGPSVPAPMGPKSGSIAIFGKLGGGKSFAIKRIVADTVAMGHQVVAIDRTPMGEYVRLAPALSGRSQVVHLAAGSHTCLDPLRIFSGEEAINYARGFLTLLTGTSPTSTEGAVLAEAVVKVAHHQGRLRDVIAELDRVGTEDPDARLVAKKLGVFTRSAGLAEVAFGDAAGLRLDADYIVFHVPGLDLPDRHILTDAHLSAQMLPDQVFSQALLYLITAVARSVAFRDRGRYTLVVQDEGYVLTASAQGRQLLGEIARDGRKHNAGLCFASHHPEDLGDPRLGELMGSRFLFRLDRTATEAGLRFMGLEPDDENRALIEEAARATGQCLYRDLDGAVGLIHILEPQTEALRHAFDTNPTGDGDEEEVPHQAGARRRAVVRRPAVRPR